ncbi:MAG: hypothetical protein LC777_12910, partial [Actinobacteria bacterium]|nr:hypothetical protein [Actinomycetota bacterium]
DRYIEFLGLAGDASYDEKTQRKIALAETSGLKLTLLKADDLRDLVALERRLLEIAAAADRADDRA